MENLSIYIHWPFCERKCPYCDFNSYVTNEVDHHRWLKAYETALQDSFLQTKKRSISSIYFGGGTPSLMAPFVIEGILDKIASIYHLSQNIEITMEANPTTFEADRFKAFRSVGINRLSLGVQSMREDALRFLGRWHDVADAKKVIAFAKKYFDRYSFDLIYARPDQYLDEWKKELKEALGYADGHLSLYQLTIEAATEFGRKKIPEAPEGRASKMYLYTLEVMEKANLPAYEISNFAQKGQESQHNLAYWRQQDWIGVGPGAHGRFTVEGKRFATQDGRHPGGWLDYVEARGHGRGSMQRLPLDEQHTEKIMTGLRMAEGISSDLWGTIAQYRIDEMIKQNYLQKYTNGNIAATRQGWLVLDGVLRWLLADETSEIS